MSACIILTTSGLVLVNWQREDAPSKSTISSGRRLCMSMLGPLLASLVQFSQGSEFGHLELTGGIQVIMSTDSVAQVAVAVVFEGCESELARLKSLVVLSQAVSQFRDIIERLASAHSAHARLMADAYTLSQALEGMLNDGEDANETKSEFYAFEQAFVAPTMSRSVSDCCCSLSLLSTPKQTAIIQASLINAESATVIFSKESPESTQDSQSWLRVFESMHTKRTIESAALALHTSFPLLYKSSLLRHGGFSSFRATSTSASNTMTLIVHLASKEALDAYLALQMLSTGVFAACAMFVGNSALLFPTFDETHGSGLESDDLQRLLMADARGTQLLKLLQQPTRSPKQGDPQLSRSPKCRLLVGSTEIPQSVSDVLTAINHMWTPQPPALSKPAQGISSKEGSGGLDEWGSMDVEQQLSNLKLSLPRVADRVQ